MPKTPGILWANKPRKKGVSTTQNTEGKSTSFFNRVFSVTVKIHSFSQKPTAGPQLCFEILGPSLKHSGAVDNVIRK